MNTKYFPKNMNTEKTLYYSIKNTHFLHLSENIVKIFLRWIHNFKKSHLEKNTKYSYEYKIFFFFKKWKGEYKFVAKIFRLRKFNKNSTWIHWTFHSLSRWIQKKYEIFCLENSRKKRIAVKCSMNTEIFLGEYRLI